MTVPQWALLGFAVWTVLLLFATIGFYRWARILTGRTQISEWQADVPQGSEWYRRAMRAHMNCVENLPVFAGIVFCVTAAGASGKLLDALSVFVLGGRIAQTIIHISVRQTNTAAALRFAFFLIQALSMLAMAVLCAIAALK